MLRACSELAQMLVPWDCHFRQRHHISGLCFSRAWQDKTARRALGGYARQLHASTVRPWLVSLAASCYRTQHDRILCAADAYVRTGSFEPTKRMRH